MLKRNKIKKKITSVSIILKRIGASVEQKKRNEQDRDIENT